jgi:hypothetical protein
MGWINRLVNVFRKDRLRSQIDEELEFHLAASARDNVVSSGIRMAVGTRKTQVLRQIVGDTFRRTLPRALIGAGSAYALSALLPSG